MQPLTVPIHKYAVYIILAGHILGPYKQVSHTALRRVISIKLLQIEVGIEI